MNSNAYKTENGKRKSRKDENTRRIVVFI